jgi:PAS domain S-box-containing protein
MDSNPELFSIAFLKSPNPIIYVDKSGVVFLFNDAFEEQFSISPSDGINIKDLELIDYETKSKWDFEKYFLSDNPHPQKSHLFYSSTDESKIFSTQITFAVNERTPFLCLIFNDETDYKLLQRKLEDRKEILHGLINDFPCMLCAIGSDGKFKIWNKQCENITGYSKSDILDNSDAMALLFPDLEQRKLILQSWNNREYIYNKFEIFDVVCKNGQTKKISWALRYRDTALIYGVYNWGIAFDITEETSNQQKLGEKEQKLDAISKVTHDAIWDWNFDNNYLWWSDGMTRLFGHEGQDIENSITWWEENIHPEDKQRVKDRIYDFVKRKEEYWWDEYRFRRKDNTYSHVLDKGLLVFNSNGDAIRMIGGIMDITERKLFENSLLVKNAQLEEYAFFNSHKVRGPLARLMGLVQLIQSSNGNNIDRSELDKKIISAAEELDQMIKEISTVLAS